MKFKLECDVCGEYKILGIPQANSLDEAVEYYKKECLDEIFKHRCSGTYELREYELRRYPVGEDKEPSSST